MFKDEAFEKYWNRRVRYRHPEENKKKLKHFAKKMFYAGWDYGYFTTLGKTNIIEKFGVDE